MLCADCRLCARAIAQSSFGGVWHGGLAKEGGGGGERTGLSYRAFTKRFCKWAAEVPGRNMFSRLKMISALRGFFLSHIHWGTPDPPPPPSPEACRWLGKGPAWRPRRGEGGRSVNGLSD